MANVVAQGEGYHTSFGLILISCHISIIRVTRMVNFCKSKYAPSQNLKNHVILYFPLCLLVPGCGYHVYKQPKRRLYKLSKTDPICRNCNILLFCAMIILGVQPERLLHDLSQLWTFYFYKFSYAQKTIVIFYHRSGTLILRLNQRPHRWCTARW